MGDSENDKPLNSASLGSVPGVKGQSTQSQNTDDSSLQSIYRVGTSLNTADFPTIQSQLTVNNVEPNPNDNALPENAGDPPPACAPGCVGNRRRESPATLSHIQRFLGGSGHILNDLCASLWFSYLLLYLQDVVSLTPANAGYLMLLGQIVDGLATPLIGYEADRANHCWLCKKGYGRCKSWHLVGVILVTISFPFVFSPCIECENADEWAKVVYYAPFITIFQIGWAASQISHLALIPKMDHDVLIRTELYAIRYGFTIASNVTVFIMTMLFLGFKDCEVDPTHASSFMNMAIVAVCVGGFFSLLFHLFVVERTDEEIKKTTSLMEANENAKTAETTAQEQQQRHRNRDLLQSLTAVTNVRSVASSMAISKVQAQARRRRNSAASGKFSSDGEAGQSLLGDQDDIDGISVSVVGDSGSFIPSGMPPPLQNNNSDPRPVVVPNFFSTKSLNVGKENMSLVDWLTLPQFYIVALMYMSTRLSVNLTQVYIPLFLQKFLKLPCSSVATIPLTMYCSGFVVALFIKLINKYCGRQLAYTFGASLSIVGSALVLFLHWEPRTDLATKGIYGVAVLLGGGASALLVTSLSITADLIGNNIENGAFVYGAMSFCDKLSCGLAIVLINSIINPIPEDDKGPYYKNVLAYSCGGCAAMGVVAVIWLTIIIYFQNKRREQGL